MLLPMVGWLQVLIVGNAYFISVSSGLFQNKNIQTKKNRQARPHKRVVALTIIVFK